MNLWLSDDQVCELTRRKQPAAQERVLREAGISFILVDGRPVVPLSEIQQNPTAAEPKLRLIK